MSSFDWGSQNCIFMTPKPNMAHSKYKKAQNFVFFVNFFLINKIAGSKPNRINSARNM